MPSRMPPHPSSTAVLIVVSTPAQEACRNTGILVHKQQGQCRNLARRHPQRPHNRACLQLVASPPRSTLSTASRQLGVKSAAHLCPSARRQLAAKLAAVLRGAALQRRGVTQARLNAARNKFAQMRSTAESGRIEVVLGNKAKGLTTSQHAGQHQELQS